MSTIFNDDFREFIKSLNDNKVEYILVGDYAVILHGYRRVTGDIDIWVNQKRENYLRLVKAFFQIGLPLFDMSEEKFMNSESADIFSFGRPPVSMDILTRLKGVEFKSAFSKDLQFDENGLIVRFIHLNNLIEAKKASGRFKDLDDIEKLTLFSGMHDIKLNYHLAQVNIGKILAPMDSPVMAEFKNNLDRINALAESSEGFVWRLKEDNNNATSIKVFEDDFMLINMSVWKDIDSLYHYVYESAHMEYLKKRKAWFEKLTEKYMALWWIPAGHIPTPSEAIERINHIRHHGDTAFAFGFKKRFTAEEAAKA